MTQIGVLVGNPRPASRTLQAALALREALASTLGVPVDGPVIEAATLAPAVFTEPDTVKAALATLGQADVLVVATPTYKAAYTGLLKAVLDQAPPGWLKGKVVVPLQIAASDKHALAVEVHLRPVLAELGALVPQALFLNEAALPADAADFDLDALKVLR
ncbi:NAD(P)H-dependent oxidoreductase [Lentzea sp. BCCO 10_0061]|uniref:NAD(P)H-dependent oxidoreductase n=1 Tax=Lentzea sokolovensis TaxID=3095429 RepID=A0ABU4UU47_9PSEU|nr:NAD(P)H-dependent oxidoreductase [Lentzea sp. BCCO 10_0061]MDX8143032.1 NAD(P)H-dependent oxidoreductase [Lentzea sp. BCCO 10_0061]